MGRNINFCSGPCAIQKYRFTIVGNIVHVECVLEIELDYELPACVGPMRS